MYYHLPNCIMGVLQKESTRSFVSYFTVGSSETSFLVSMSPHDVRPYRLTSERTLDIAICLLYIYFDARPDLLSFGAVRVALFGAQRASLSATSVRMTSTCPDDLWYCSNTWRKSLSRAYWGDRKSLRIFQRKYRTVARMRDFLPWHVKHRFTLSCPYRDRASNNGLDCLPFYCEEHAQIRSCSIKILWLKGCVSLMGLVHGIS